jgi:hypothetical protein
MPEYVHLLISEPCGQTLADAINSLKQGVSRRLIGNTIARLRACTYAGQPFGDETLVKEMGARFGRQWTRGRPKKEGKAVPSAEEPANQFALF